MDYCWRCIHAVLHPRSLVFVDTLFKVRVELQLEHGYQVEGAPTTSFYAAVEKANEILRKYGHEPLDGTCGLTKEEQETIEMLL